MKYFLYTAKEKLKIFFKFRKTESRRGRLGIIKVVRYSIIIPHIERKLSIEFQKAPKDKYAPGIWIVFFIIFGFIAVASAMVCISEIDKDVSEISLIISVFSMAACVLLVGHNVFNK